MSEIKYGLISKVDADCLEKTIDLIVAEQSKQSLVSPFIVTTEIGVFDGQTSRGLNEYIRSKGKIHVHYAIDSEKDKPILKPFEDCELIIGNSNEVYNQIRDESQDLIFIDGCHCFAHVVSDFFCYAPKIKRGGYIAFHDTGRHINPFKDFQHGDEKNPDAYISVRKALDAIGMFKDAGYDIINNNEGTFLSPRYLGGHGFRMVFDEADESDEAGGLTVFRKK